MIPPCLRRCPRMARDVRASINGFNVRQHVHTRPYSKEVRPLTTGDEAMYSQGAEETFHVFRRLIKFGVYASLGLGLSTIAAYEGAHMYVEKVALAAPTEHDSYGWSREKESWTGSTEKGGTDSRLGWRGRHAVRSAWMVLNWAPEFSLGVIESSQSDDDGYSGRDRALGMAIMFLDSALAIARQKQNISQDDASDPVIRDLMLRRADVLGRTGGRSDLIEAYASYTRVWAATPNGAPDRARLAVKLGDMGVRLGEDETARASWIGVLEDANVGSPEGQNFEFLAPYDQRTVLSALLSLSTHYATTRDLEKAAHFQRLGLSLEEKPKTQPSPRDRIPFVLHQLFIQHRLALLSIHLAEVTYAQNSVKQRKKLPPTDPLPLLRHATELAENVNFVLSGLPFDLTTAYALTHLPTPTFPLSPIFSSGTLLPSALKLHLHAKRAAVESLNLTGILLEETGQDEHALETFERALAWAGGVDKISDDSGAMSEGEWRGVWKNYVRVRERVLKRGASPSVMKK